MAQVQLIGRKRVWLVSSKDVRFVFKLMYELKASLITDIPSKRPTSVSITVVVKVLMRKKHSNKDLLAPQQLCDYTDYSICDHVVLGLAGLIMLEYFNE
ncbi:CLUMA_CG012398, isoform A [Clunio marinus]|uniref:CLUMA_CG012398, isoform A n=1 Tax=Clunio marinus TaxID=568069 RepID=A0A1J1IES1_9DIPT|nr:CLUMA_CG012398, isoform A [Clunio marinus]